MASLPTVLAGPILRRCSQSYISVWLATSKPVTHINIALSIWKSDSANTPLATNNQIRKFKLGKNLYIYFFKASPVNGKFPADTFITYQIGDRLSSDGHILGPLDGMEGLAYAPFQHPTLVLQAKGSKDLRALYGSCRKFHGKGFDATVAAEIYFQYNHLNLEKRPTALLLGGDQIYADDVPGILMRPIQILAKKLFGFEEPMPGIKHPYRLQLDSRKKLLLSRGYFTSGYSDNHLMTFGEFCATYLMAWNQNLWPSQLVTGGKENFALQEPNVLAFKEGTARIRRLFANIPTYMAFDDHEITDDWFLNRAWKRKVSSSSAKLEKRIMSNGLAAFWVFQAYGNAHHFRDKSLRKAFQKYIRNLQQPTSKSSRVAASRFLRFNEWSFSSATYPKVVFLNTRTRRTGSSKNHKYNVYNTDGTLKNSIEISKHAPRLMNSRERVRAKKLLNNAIHRDRRIILFTATPVYGIPAIEALVETAINLHKNPSIPKQIKPFISPKKLDFESFHANPQSHLDLIQILLSLRANPRLVIILSGDVHYASSAAVMIETEKKPGIQLAQFTSSATKNHPEGIEESLLDTLGTINPASAPRLNFWWRPSHSSLPQKISVDQSKYLLKNAALVNNGDTEVKKAIRTFKRLSRISDFKFAEIYRFESATRTHFTEKSNNIGSLELSDTHVQNKLLTMKQGVYTKTLTTNWKLGHANWPAYVRIP